MLSILKINQFEGQEIKLICLRKKQKDLHNGVNQEDEYQSNSCPKYNEVIGRKQNEGLILKLKRVHESNIIEEKIDPGKLQAGVSHMKFLIDGGIAISCEKTD